MEFAACFFSTIYCGNGMTKPEALCQHTAENFDMSSNLHHAAL